MTEQHVIITGGGIAGLTLAVALEHRGHPVVVLERRPAYGNEGAGILVAQNALRMFDRIGLGAAIRRAGLRIGSMDVRTSDDVLLQRVEAFDTVTIHRNQLHRILRDAIRGPVHMDCAPREIQIGESEVVVQSRLGSHRADLLVGADGIRSDVRRRVFGEFPVQSSGQTCWRAVVPMELDGAVEYWAPGRRVGVIPLSGERTYVYLVRDQVKGAVDPWGEDVTALRAEFEGFPTQVQAVLAAVESVSELRRGHLEQVQLPQWHGHRAVLIGDAAHAMTPNMGQGACQAIEDALVLATTLDEAETLEDALDRYAQLRRSRVDAIQRQSWWIGKVSQMQSPVGRFLRDGLMRLTPSWSTRRAARALGEVPGVH